MVTPQSEQRVGGRTSAILERVGHSDAWEKPARSWAMVRSLLAYPFVMPTSGDVLVDVRVAERGVVSLVERGEQERRFQRPAASGELEARLAGGPHEPK